MRSNQAVGFSLVGQAHLGLIIFSALFAVSLAFSFDKEVIFYGLVFGTVTALLLLAYWLGKGGKFFILAVLSPLVCIVFTPLTSFLAIANLLGAFFVGLCLLLTLYKLKKGS